MLIDDPNEMTQEQAEGQVEKLDGGYLAHVFSSCDASLGKTVFVVELASDWMKSKDSMRRRCGYGLLYEISKFKKKSAPGDAFFMERIKHIDKAFSGEKRPVQGAMGGALMGIGKRNVKLNAASLKVERKIGQIQMGSDERECDPFDVVKHLTSDYITKKLGV